MGAAAKPHGVPDPHGTLQGRRPAAQHPQPPRAAAEINYGTVTRAYRDLELGGLIVSVRGRGMFVQKHLPMHEDEGALAADAAARDCISQYRALE